MDRISELDASRWSRAVAFVVVVVVAASWKYL
jgi:hypothetical protein